MQEVVVIDYGMGNLHSVQKALSFLDAQPKLSQDAEEIRTAQKLILPGVGAFGDAMAELSRRGLVQAIQAAVGKGTPLMGICLGMQLLFESSTEGGWQQGLSLGKLQNLPYGKRCRIWVGIAWKIGMKKCLPVCLRSFLFILCIATVPSR